MHVAVLDVGVSCHLHVAEWDRCPNSFARVISNPKPILLPVYPGMETRDSQEHLWSPIFVTVLVLESIPLGEIQVDQVEIFQVPFGVRNLLPGR